MRLWLVDPKTLCDKHLLGEHNECHMFVGTLLKKKSVQGYLDKGLLQTHSIARRHAELVNEMIRRGMNHQSPLPVFPFRIEGNISIENNYRELRTRCKRCEKLQREHGIFSTDKEPLLRTATSA